MSLLLFTKRKTPFPLSGGGAVVHRPPLGDFLVCVCVTLSLSEYCSFRGGWGGGCFFVVVFFPLKHSVVCLFVCFAHAGLFFLHIHIKEPIFLLTKSTPVFLVGWMGPEAQTLSDTPKLARGAGHHGSGPLRLMVMVVVIVVVIEVVVVVDIEACGAPWMRACVCVCACVGVCLCSHCHSKLYRWRVPGPFGTVCVSLS